MSYGPETSIRRACYDNLISKNSLLMLEGLTPDGVWFVDSTVSSSGSGKNWSSAFSTIDEAVDAASAYDTIFLKGSFSEAINCTTVGIKFIGVGSTPRETVWTAPTVAGSYCLTMGAAYQRVENIYMKPVIYTSSGVPAGIKLSGANWGVIRGVRFQGQTGSYKAIYSAVCDTDNLLIEDCDFMYMNTATNGAAILGVEAGGLSYSGWKILNSRFNSCVTGIDVNMRASLIRGCEFAVTGVAAAGTIGTVCTLAIDLSGTSSGGNTVTENTLDGAYTTALYKSGAGGDNWRGNYAAITSTTAPNGLTVEVPAS
jgi:hypothetical protein